MDNFNFKKRLYTKYKSNAKQTGKEFSLTLDEFIKLIDSPCFYCGLAPSNKIKGRLYKNEKEFVNDNHFFLYNGIDRKNNTLGYTQTNSVSCCKLCNQAKNSLSIKEFYDHIQLILNNKGNQIE